MNENPTKTGCDGEIAEKLTKVDPEPGPESHYLLRQLREIREQLGKKTEPQ